MEKITASNLKEEVMKLQPGELLYISLDESDCNTLLLMQEQIKSCENLFTSYVNNTTEAASELNLEKFLKKYTELRTDKEDLFHHMQLKTLGTEIYDYIMNRENGLACRAVIELKKLQIFKRP